jgi:glycine cleavage system aminomethyltransferase T
MSASVGKYILRAYLPTQHAVAGTKLQMHCMNKSFPATVPSGGAVFDPENTRLRA